LIEGMDGAWQAEILMRAVAACCKDWDIFHVVHHSVEATLVADKDDVSCEFFTQPPARRSSASPLTCPTGRKATFIISNGLTISTNVPVKLQTYLCF